MVPSASHKQPVGPGGCERSNTPRQGRNLGAVNRPPRWSAGKVPVLRSPFKEIKMTDNKNAKKTFAERAATEPTELHKRFAEWIEKETGVKPDLKTVQLAVALRMDFQRSDNNQSSLAERKAAAAKKEADRVAKRKAQLEKELAKLSSAVEVKTEEPPAEEPAKADEQEATEAQADAPAEVEEVAPAAAEATEEKAEESAVEEAPKPARRSRRSRTVGAEPVK